MIPKELSKEEIIKIIQDKKQAINVHKFVNSSVKIYNIQNTSIVILEKTVYFSDKVVIHHKYLDYSSVDNVYKLFAKYAKKYGRNEIIVTFPYDFVIKMLKDFK